MFTGVFAEHLGIQVGVRAREPRDGEPLTPGTVFIAPGGRHMGLMSVAGQPVVRLDDGPPVNFCRPAVDVLFRDSASIFGASALAVVLTGMGSDGTEGSRLLVRAGATVLAQNEATSTVWGMPGSVAKAGLAQDILPLDALGPALKGYITGSPQ
jgi:two-component system chemotaxis response regulator CheB